MTTLEEARSKVFNATFLFAGVTLYFGLVLTNLAQGFEDHFFRDIAFALLELFGLAIGLGSAYRVIRQDVKKGSGVEMLFVRPLRRWEYLAGRFFGIGALLAVGLAVMGGTLAGLIAVKGFQWHWLYLAVFAEIYFKLLIVLAVAFLLALATTSQASYFISCLLVWASAHVMHLLKALLDRSARPDVLSAILIKPLAYLLPNFSLFSTANHMDGILGGAIVFSGAQFVFSAAYALIYSIALLAFSAYIFSRAEILP